MTTSDEGTGALFSIYEGQYEGGKPYFEISGPGVSRYNSACTFDDKFRAEQTLRLIYGAYNAGKLAKAKDVAATLRKLLEEP